MAIICRTALCNRYILVVLCLISFATSATAQTVFTGLGVEEYQPRLPFSGRVDAVAINPDNEDQVLVTTESGGLFQSLDNGSTWRHVDSLPAMDLRDVHYIPDEMGMWILVTAEADFENRSATGSAGTVVASNGGIWISRDNGDSWIHPDSAVPRANSTPSNILFCPPDVSAFGADVDPETGRVFVATNCGVSYSDDAGNTWEHVFFGISSRPTMLRTFVTVAALDGDGVVLGGRDGIWFSENNGDIGTWIRETTGIGRVASRDIHAAGRVNGLTDAAYIVIPDAGGFRELYRSTNMGRSWAIRREDPPKPDSLGCGGNAHVYAFFRPDALGPGRDVELVFYGNSCLSYYLQGRGRGAEEIKGSHPDTRAIAFNPGINVPKFLASDGGLDRSRIASGERTSSFWESSNWEPIGSGPGKINALQLYNVSGQAVIGTDEYRLAIGTQDNSLWSSDDDGLTWPENQSAEPEGGNIQMKRRVLPGESDRWTYWRCAECKRKFSDPLFQNTEDWPGISLLSGCSFLKFGKHFFADGRFASVVEPTGDDDSIAECRVPGLEFTEDFGRGYVRLLTITPPNQRAQGTPIVGLSAYFPLIVGDISIAATNGNDGTVTVNDTELVRIDNLLFPPRSTRFPAMNNCDPTSMDSFGSMGYYGANWEWPAVFGGSLNGGIIIAPDIENDRLMITRNGGECWSEMPDLSTGKLTQGGKYKFSWVRQSSRTVFSQVSAISFFPENPELIALGTQQGGIYLSGDMGVSWIFVPGSESIPNITSFHWKSANEIYVSSFGRGLWKVSYMASFGLSDLITSLRDGTSQSRFVSRLQFGDDPEFGSPAPRVTPPEFQVIVPPDDPKFSLISNEEDALAQPDSSLFLLDALLEQQLDTVVIVAGGHIRRIRNAKRSDASLAEQVQVSAGAALLLFAPPEAAFEDNTSTRSGLLMNDQETAVLQNALLDPPNAVGSKVIGLGFKDGDLIGIVTGSGISYVEPELTPVNFPPEEPVNPPAYHGPVVALTGASPGIGFLPGQTVLLSGGNFAPDIPIEIFLDGEYVASKLVPDNNGEFEVSLKLENLAVGLYELRIQQLATQQEFVDTVLILHNDK